MNPASGSNAPVSSWPPALVGAFLHGLAWIVMLFLCTIFVPPIVHTFQDFSMRVPTATEWTVAAARWLFSYSYVALAAVVVFVVFDAVVLRALDRPGTPRIVREVWSALALGLPVLALVYGAYTLTLPSAKLIEGMMRSGAAHSEAAQAELQRLAGTWKLIGLERDGVSLPAAKIPHEQLTLEGDHFTWAFEGHEMAGVCALQLRRKPTELSLRFSNGPNTGMDQSGLYKLEGDKLTLCLAEPGSFADDLPADFTTRGNRNELLVWQRQR
jgi:uncharacterized protein (TIGR03067 family)